MARSDNLYELPKNLPVPQDDGACDHLTGMTLPPIGLPSTRGRVVDLWRLAGTTVVYIYPRTGRPDQEVPTGWNDIPGARGCTPQSCAFRDHFAELQRAGAAHVFGLSTQDSAYQREAAERLLASIREGKSLVEAAREKRVGIERTEPLGRRPDGFVPGLGPAPEVLAAAFALSPERPSSEGIFQ